jgi:hypothetical protein
VKKEKDGAEGMHGKKGNAYRVSVGKHEGKMPLGSPRYIWENNSKIYIKETALEAVDRVDVVEDSGGLL